MEVEKKPKKIVMKKTNEKKTEIEDVTQRRMRWTQARINSILIAILCVGVCINLGLNLRTIFVKTETDKTATPSFSSEPNFIMP